MRLRCHGDGVSFSSFPERSSGWVLPLPEAAGVFGPREIPRGSFRRLPIGWGFSPTPGPRLPDGHQLRVNSEGYAWLRFAQCRGALFGSWGTFAVGLSDVRGLISTHFDQSSDLGRRSCLSFGGYAGKQQQEMQDFLMPVELWKFSQD